MTFGHCMYGQNYAVMPVSSELQPMQQCFGIVIILDIIRAQPISNLQKHISWNNFSCSKNKNADRSEQNKTLKYQRIYSSLSLCKCFVCVYSACMNSLKVRCCSCSFFVVFHCKTNLLSLQHITSLRTPHFSCLSKFLS